MGKQTRQFGSRWFRVYDEAVDEPKLVMLSDKLHRFLFNCWCLASKNDGYLPPVSQIACRLRKSTTAVCAMLAELHERGLMDDEGDTFTPHNWAYRQYQSDSSTQRVRNFRERHRNGNETFRETGNETPATVTETPSEQIQNRTEQKQSRTDANFPETPRLLLHSRKPPEEPDFNEIGDWFEDRMRRHPNKRDTMLAQTILSEIPEAIDPRWRKEVARVHDLWCETEAWRWKAGARAGTFAAWLTDKGWKYEPPEERSDLDRAMEAL